MPAGLTGTEIASDLVDRHRSLGAFGKPAWQSHLPLRALIRQRLGDRCANFFAVPNLDVETGLLRWTTDATGPVRPWHTIDPQERALRAFEVEEIRSRLLGLEQELGRQGGTDVSGSASFASLLKQARCVPSHEGFLYMVGEQPVVAFWGFETRAPETMPNAAPSAPSPVPAAVPASPIPSPAPSVAVARPWWRWLLWLLLLILLILLLLGLLRGCEHTGAVPVDRPSAGIAGAAPDPDRPARAPAESQGTAGPSPDGPILRPGEPAQPGAAARSSGSDKPLDPAEPIVPPATAGPAPGAPSVLPGTPITPPAAPASPATAPPPPPAGSAAPASPPAAAPPFSKPPLVIPPGSSSLGFLKGDWGAETGLIDRQSGQSLNLTMSFDDQGRGRLRLQRADGSSCEGPLQASRSGSGLVMEARQALPCSNGGSFESPRIECAPLLDGKTDCFGRNPDGTRFGMEVRRR